MTKQVELIVRFNFTVPATADTAGLFVNIPLANVQVLDVNHNALEAKGNEYETMDVYEPS